MAVSCACKLSQIEPAHISVNEGCHRLQDRPRPCSASIQSHIDGEQNGVDEEPFGARRLPGAECEHAHERRDDRVADQQ